MLKIISIPFSLLAAFFFLLSLCVFHPIQWVCINLFGYRAHKKSVDILSFFLQYSVLPLFSTTKVENRNLIPVGRPLIFVANHQGLYDIVGFQWFFRKYHPKFVSKKELGKGIPSVSYNLNHGGSVLIDRKDPKQALPLLKQLGEYIEANNRSAIIFPEGTRTKNGQPKSFAPNGLKILCKYAPNALVVPVTINNSWKIFRYGAFPLGLGSRIKFTVHQPIAVKDFDYNTLFEMTENAVVKGIDTK
jgi:1-acyl-sn-glycerol-3-phosphate acyltransferase